MTKVLSIFSFCISISWAEWPTQWSGNLPRPILFIHGINSDMGTWGAKVAGKVCHEPVVSILETEVTSLHRSYNCSMTFESTCQDGAKLRSTVIRSTQNPPSCSPNSAYVIGQANLYNSGLVGKVYGYFPNSWSNGWVREYLPKSAPDTISRFYQMPIGARTYSYTNYVNSTGINHNGLEFYSSTNRLSGSNEKLEPFAPPACNENGTANQCNRIKLRIEEVLNEYYGSSWMADPSKTIDIVAHSQGGLVIRAAIAWFTSESAANPINHINSIVTLGTPHLGTALATDESGVQSIQGLRDIIVRMHESGNYPQYTVVNISSSGGSFNDNPGGNIGGIAYSYSVDVGEFVDEVLGKFVYGANFLKYPLGIKTETWLPSHSRMNASSSIDTGDYSVFVDWLSKQGAPKNHMTGKPVPLTALYGTMVDNNFAQDVLSNLESIVYGKCNGSGFLGFDIDQITWWLAGGSCSNFAGNILDGLTPHFLGLDTGWTASSDFVVDVSSQKAEGLFTSYSNHFDAFPLIPFPGDAGVPHMTLPGMGSNGDLLGECWHGAEILQALEHPPIAGYLKTLPSFSLTLY